MIADVPPGPLRDAIEPVVEMRALLPTATVSLRTERLRVVDEEGKIVVRLASETAAVRDAAGERPLPARLSVLGVRGYDAELGAVRTAIERDLGLSLAAQTLADEAVAAAGGRPGGVSSKPAIELERSERADVAAARVLAALLDAIETNLPGTLEDIDTEFLHDLRVAVRRTRSVQRQLAAVFEPGPLVHFRREFRWLQQATGPTRDLDVQLLEFDALATRLRGADADALEPLRGTLTEHRRREWERMSSALRGGRARRILAGWSALVAELGQGSPSGPEAAARPIAEITGERIARMHGKVIRLGSSIDDGSPAEALHELRKKCKELRYLLEIFGSLYSEQALKPLVKSLKRLQDTLGRHQDRAVQVELLYELRDEVAAREQGAAALMAMGGVAEELVVDQAAARAEFAERFADFAGGRLRRSAKELVE